MNKKRLLITGVSGLLGSNLAYYFRDKYEVLGLFNTHPYQPSWARTEQVDLTRPEECGRIVRLFRPDICIHCAGLADIDRCEQEREAAFETNVTLTQRVADATAAFGAYLVHISTDNVFDGKKGNYVEDDPVSPLSYYAETKVEAEQALKGRPNCLIVRTSFYGSGVTLKRSLVEWALFELSLGHQIKGFTDAITSNIYVSDFARILEVAIGSRLVGIYHAACSNARSKYDFLCDVAERFSFEPSRVIPISVDDFPFKARRPKDISLNVRKIGNCIGLEMIPSSVSSLEHFCRDRLQAGVPKAKHEDKV
jgi:dTDP-4-dehydrorhamnose reductase